MANRTLVQDNYTFIKRKVEVYAAVSVGAAGAVTLQKWNYGTFGSTASPANTYTAASSSGIEGVKSVTRTAAGLWTVKMQDGYQRCLQVYAQGQLAGGLSAIVAAGINSTLTNMSASGGSEIGVALLSATGTKLDPANGELILLTIVLADSTAP